MTHNIEVTDEAGSHLRKAAMLVASVPAKDQAWLTKQLSADDSTRLLDQVKRLNELGFSNLKFDSLNAVYALIDQQTAQPSFQSVLLSNDHDESLAQGIVMSDYAALYNAEPEQVHVFLDALPDPLVAQIVAMRGWPWFAYWHGQNERRYKKLLEIDVQAWSDSMKKACLFSADQAFSKAEFV